VVSSAFGFTFVTNDVEGGRKILGLSHGWTAVSRSNKGVEISIGGRRHVRPKTLPSCIIFDMYLLQLPTLTDPSSRALLAVAPTRSMITSDTKYKYEEIDGFLRLPSRGGRQAEQAYREITLAARDSDSGSDASSEGSSDDDSNITPLTSHQQNLKALEQQITSDSSSIPTWLSLLSRTLSTVPPTSKNAPKARSEISLSILSRALSSRPSNGTNKYLRLKYLKAGEEVWHESKLRAEWEDALKVGQVDIWMEWLEWRIRSAVGGINGVVEDAQRALRSLSDTEEGEMGRLRVIWRIAVALQNAGLSQASSTSTIMLSTFIQAS